MLTNNFYSQESSVLADTTAAQKLQIQQAENNFIKANDTTFNKVNTQAKSLLILAEIRPRAEFRYGYKQLRSDTSEPAYFINQRTRINITYKTNNFILHTSIQDIRLYGQTGQFSVNGTIGIFEAYAEPKIFKNVFFRIGRQALAIDNDRLFSVANWAQASRAHEGVRLFYKRSNFTSDLFAAFSQGKENIYGTDFSPTIFNNYKVLGIHNLRYSVNESFSFSTLTAADGFESKNNSNVLYFRATSGGRLEFTNNIFYATIAGYYQYGTNSDGRNIAAHYLQPEIKLKLKNVTTRIGAEYLTGNDATSTSKMFKSFIPLYGVAWRFMGNMDYFTTFPNDTKNGGLVNPYLFILVELNNKLLIRADGHLFFTQNNVLNNNKEVINPYLGFENDLSFRIKFNKFTTLDFGFSYIIATESMKAIKGGNNLHTPIWSYTMITFKPEIFNAEK